MQSLIEAKGNESSSWVAYHGAKRFLHGLAEQNSRLNSPFFMTIEKAGPKPRRFAQVKSDGSQIMSQTKQEI